MNSRNLQYQKSEKSRTKNSGSNSKDAVILFDGVCNLCNNSVDLIIRFDKRRVFRFTTLQSEFGKALAEKYYIPKNVDSVILLKEGKYFLESNAALKISRQLVFPVNLLYAFIIIPKRFRDSIYRWIARNRYRWFGKRKTCRLPDETDAKLFLNRDDL